MTYPTDWPRCPVCGDFALDGHVTCGRAECNESREREARSLNRPRTKTEHERATGPWPGQDGLETGQ
jgi:hypothetical protein